MGIKIWLDDVRTPPDNTWIWCKTAYEAITKLKFGTASIEHISFDHDLGHNPYKSHEWNVNNNGYFVASYIESIVHSDLAFLQRHSLSSIDSLSRFSWDIHSQNPVGRDNIRKAMQSAERFWKEQEEL